MASRSCEDLINMRTNARTIVNNIGVSLECYLASAGIDRHSLVESGPTMIRFHCRPEDSHANAIIRFCYNRLQN